MSSPGRFLPDIKTGKINLDPAPGHVDRKQLTILARRGYICPDKKAIDTAGPALVLKGRIDLNRVPASKERLRTLVEEAGHKEILVKVIDRLHVSAKLLEETLPAYLNNLSQLEQHSKVALPYDCFKTKTHVFLVSEYHGGGGNIMSYVKSQKYPKDAARYVFSGIASAVQYAHDNGIIHGHLTPSSVSVNEVGQVKVHDFGLPLELHKYTGCAYSAPEVIRARTNLTQGADIYSMGVILFEMLQGCTPYAERKGTKTLMLKKIFEQDMRFKCKMTEDAEDLIRRLMHPYSDRRPSALACFVEPWVVGRRQQRKPLPKKLPELRKYSPSIEPKNETMKRGPVGALTTIKSSAEIVMLKSRIPDKNLANVMDVKYADFCNTLQPNVQCKSDETLRAPTQDSPKKIKRKAHEKLQRSVHKPDVESHSGNRRATPDGDNRDVADDGGHRTPGAGDQTIKTPSPTIKPTPESFVETVVSPASTPSPVRPELVSQPKVPGPNPSSQPSKLLRKRPQVARVILTRKEENLDLTKKASGSFLPPIGVTGCGFTPRVVPQQEKAPYKSGRSDILTSVYTKSKRNVQTTLADLTAHPRFCGNIVKAAKAELISRKESNVDLGGCLEVNPLAAKGSKRNLGPAKKGTEKSTLPPIKPGRHVKLDPIQGHRFKNSY